MSPTFSMRRSIIFPATIIAGGILIAIQTTTLERLKAVLIGDPDRGAYRPGLLQELWSIVPELSAVDWVLLGSLVAVVLGLIVAEVRSRRVSTELLAILASRSHTVTLVGILSAAIARFYLSPGEFVLGDGPTHVTRVWTAARSLSEGHWPSWSFFSYAGYPFLQFYGSLFFVTAGWVVAATGHLASTTKVVLFLFHVASAFPVYAWSRTIGATRLAALIAAMAYVLTFLHTHTVIWTGALPIALFYLLFPLMLWALEKVLASPSRGWVVLLSLTEAALVSTHHGYAAFALELVVVYLIARWGVARSARPQHSRLLAVGLGLAGGILLCGGPLWRLITEGQWVHFPVGLPVSFPGVPTLEFLKAIFIWKNLWSGWTTAYVGLSVIGLASVGGYLAFAGSSPNREEGIRRAIVIVALFALLCAARSGRLTNLALPWLAVLAGGVTHLRFSETSRRFGLVILTILFVDLGPTTIQAPYRTDREWLTKGLRRVGGQVEPHRTLVGYTSETGVHFFHWGAYGDTDLIVPTGFFPQGAPQSLASINATVDALNTPGSDPANIGDLLYLWDVSGIVTYSRDRFSTPGAVGEQEEGPPVARIDPASPLVFAKRIAIAQDDSLKALQRIELLMGRSADDPERRFYLDRMAQWVEAMRIDRDRARARVIFVAAPGGEATRQNSGAGLEGLRTSPAVVSNPDDYREADGDGPTDTTPDARVAALEVRRCDVELRRVTLTYEALQAGYIRAAFSWYPTLRVLIDGEPVTPMRSLFGALVIPTQPGEHTIELVPSSKPSDATVIGPILGLLLIAAAAAQPRRR